MKQKKMEKRNPAKTIRAKIEATMQTKKGKIISLIFCILLCTMVLLIPYAVRHYLNNNALLGDEAYHHATIAKQISEKGLIAAQQDSLVYGGRKNVVTPYHLLIALSGDGVGIEAASKILPPLLGILSIIIFYAVLRNLGLDNTTTVLSCLMLIVSPIFINVFTYSTPYYLLVFLSLLGFMLFTNKSTAGFVASIPIILLVPFFGVVYGVIFALILLSYSLSTGRKMNKTFAIIGLILISLVFIFINLTQPSINQYSAIHQREAIKEMASDLGGFFGFGMFTIILAAIAFIKIPKKRENTITYLVASAIFLFAIFINANMNIYLNLAIAALAASGLLILLDQEWESEIIKSLAITLIFCGLAFSAISHINTAVKEPPGTETMGAVYELKSMEQGNVLSHYSNGYLIKYAGKIAMLDDLSTNKKILADAEKLFYSRNMDEISSILKEYRIKYIWVDQEMLHGEVWSKEDEGLLLILHESPEFKRIFQNSRVEIWRYQG